MEPFRNPDDATIRALLERVVEHGRLLGRY
jgi:hypothetical protein